MSEPANDGNTTPITNELLQAEYLRLSRHIPTIEKLTFVSKPLKRTFSSLRLPLYLRQHGCWLSEARGDGKTRAIQYCEQALRFENPGLPVYSINQHVLPGNELRSFFYRALIKSQHISTSGTASIMRQRLASFWAELSRQSPLGQVVLLIDEGQAMRETDLTLLKDLSNDMANMSGTLQTFVFGESPKLDVQVKKFKATNAGGEVDRVFGGRKFRLHRYETLEDWESLLSEMDSGRFIELDNKSISEFFFGHVDISRFSFAKESQAFWQALNSVEKKNKGLLNLRNIFFSIRYAIHKTMEETLFGNKTELVAFRRGLWREALLQALSVSDQNKSAS